MTRFSQALAAIVPVWRHFCDSGLPLWALLGRRSRSLRRLDALKAELRCQRCDLKPSCRRRVRGGIPVPARGCPNAELFFH